MKSAVISIKTTDGVKDQIHEVANALGISVSSLVDHYLKQILHSKKEVLRLDEIPNRYLVKAIQEARKERKAGKASPIFDNKELY